MKELALIFNNTKEANYHFRNIKNGEIKNINIVAFWEDSKQIILECYDNKNFNFIQKLFGKKELKQIRIYFKSKNSNLNGFLNKKYLDKDLETNEVFQIIKKEI